MYRLNENEKLVKKLAKKYDAFITSKEEDHILPIFVSAFQTSGTLARRHDSATMGMGELYNRDGPSSPSPKCTFLCNLSCILRVLTTILWLPTLSVWHLELRRVFGRRHHFCHLKFEMESFCATLVDLTVFFCALPINRET